MSPWSHLPAGDTSGLFRTLTDFRKKPVSPHSRCLPGAAYGGLSLTPHIIELHRAGAQRGQGPLGDELERVHKRAESVGKIETAAGVALVALHVFTLGARRPEDEDESVAPLPPGPVGAGGGSPPDRDPR